MIAALHFGAAERLADGRSLRSATFAFRSTLPLAVVCTVANGVREQLQRLVAAEVDVELIEPAVPSADARSTLFAGATVTRVRGRIADAYAVVRPVDARRLVALAFGERQRPDQTPLSHIESRVLARIVGAVLPLCAPLCGPLGAASRETPERAMQECAAYFELRIGGPLRAAIGFALTREPPEDVRAPFRIEDLYDVPVEARVELGRVELPLPALAALRPGAALSLATRLDDAAVLRVGTSAVARGTCGVSDGFAAFVVGEPATPSAAA